MEGLPLDIFFNILSRIPLKSLLQSRSVSKLWRQVIDHPFLGAMHTSRCSTQEPSMLLKISYHNTHNQKPLSFHLVKEHHRTLKATDNPIATFFDWNCCTPMGSCHGLLCFSYNKEKQRLILCNPLRNVFSVLPKATIHGSDEDVVSCGLGFDARTGSYKVVRIICSIGYPNVSRVEVNRVGTSSWKETIEVPPYPVHGKAVFANGFLHWLVSPFVEQLEGMNLIVSFDVGKEKFQSTPHPKYQSRNPSQFQLLDLKGKLGMVDLSSGEKIDIWVVNDWERKEWVREYEIGIHAPWGRCNNGHVQVVGMWENGEILLKTDEGFFVYSSETGLRYNHSLGLESDSILLYSLRGSLINLG